MDFSDFKKFFLIYLFGRIPYPNQHGSGGRIRPPFLGLPNLPTFPSPLPPLPPKQYHPETTKLELERTKPKENDNSVGGDTVSTVNAVTEENVQINEVEGPALSSKVAPSAAPPSQDMAMTLVPVAAGCALIVGLGMGIWSLRNRFCDSRKSKTNTVPEIYLKSKRQRYNFFILK